MNPKKEDISLKVFVSPCRRLHYHYCSSHHREESPTYMVMRTCVPRNTRNTHCRNIEYSLQKRSFGEILDRAAAARVVYCEMFL